MEQMAARPTCARCLRPVERLEEHVDSFGRLVIRVVCHGNAERVVIDPGEGAPTSVAGLAFVPAGPPRLAQ